MFRRGSVTLFSVRGVPVRAHWSILLVIPYIAFIFAGDFPRVALSAGVPPERVVLPALFWGAIVTIGLFVSVAIHELAHAMVAMRLGGKIRDITLMLLGGVSNVERMPRRPRAEALMAAVGPLTSLALAGGFELLRGAVPVSAADQRMGLFYLARINLVLAIFNLLPAFPMDGGRVLRGLLAGPLGQGRATSIAAGVGRVLAVGMGMLGLWTGNFLLLLIAMFVFFGAGAEAQGERAKAVLRGLHVADVMVADPPSVDLGTPLADLPQRMRRSGRAELVVVDGRNHPLGLIRAHDLQDIPPAARETLHVQDLADRFTRAMVVATSNQDATEALEAAAAVGADYVVAVAPDAADAPLVGLVGPTELAHALTMHVLERGIGAPATSVKSS